MTVLHIFALSVLRVWLRPAETSLGRGWCCVVVLFSAPVIHYGLPAGRRPRAQLRLPHWQATLVHVLLAVSLPQARELRPKSVLRLGDG